mmetsp:Transcript_47879/g.125350  ORF Transcript_47879/g.125350 Transcript_47879/m.125350 type:complete len:231 (-) Transcript_47879:436-1128(-)
MGHDGLGLSADELVGDTRRASHGAVATDSEDQIDTFGLEGVANLGCIMPSAGGSKQRATLPMDGLDASKREFLPLLRIEAHIPMPDAIDRLDAILMAQAVDKLLDNCVEPRAQPAARDDRGLGLLGGKVHMLAWASQCVADECRQRIRRAQDRVCEDHLTLVNVQTGLRYDAFVLLERDLVHHAAAMVGRRHGACSGQPITQVGDLGHANAWRVQGCCNIGGSRGDIGAV